MMSDTLERVLEEVRALRPEERRLLRAQLDQLEADEPCETLEERLDRLMMERGILSHIPTGVRDPSNSKEFEPIKIKGKPLSETIIEDRR